MWTRILTRSSALPRHMVQQKASLVSGPPKYRIAFSEKLVLGSLMVVGVCAPSAWILANVENYKKQAGAE